MYKYVILALMVLLLAGCSNDMGNNNELDENMEMNDETSSLVEYKKISAKEAKALMVDGNLILDVRTKEEFNEGYIDGAILLPVDQILNGDYGPLTDKDQVILIYCRSGNRSGKAAKALIEAGYTKIYDFGGIIDWPYDIVK